MIQTDTVSIGLERLSLDDVMRVARDYVRVAPLTAEAQERMRATADWVAQTVEGIEESRNGSRGPAAYYGINTGFGARAGKSVLNSVYLTKVLGRNLIASHSVGVGRYFDESTVRAAMLIRAQSIAQGYSGVRCIIVDKLIAMLNGRVYPSVPEQGSLGASGDLAPLAHLLLVMCDAPRPDSETPGQSVDATDGEAFVPCTEANGAYLHITEDHDSGSQVLWKRLPGSEAMARVGGKVELHAKEALALMNGSTFSAAIAALVVHDAQSLLDHADLAAAMSLEGIRGFRDPLFPHLHRARGHVNAERVGERTLHYLAKSELLDPGDLRTNPKRIPPQDPYSFHCVPQVLGSISDTLDLARRWVDMDVNAVTNNPLIFLDLERSYKAMSGGNFHGEPIAFAMVMRIAMTEIASLAERRMFNLLLPDFLIDEPAETEGLNSGLMMLQATAAALVSDCKALSHPDSIDSIPSSGYQEDHVSMSLNAARTRGWS